MAKPRLVKVRALFYVLQQVMKRGCIGILIHPHVFFTGGGFTEGEGVGGAGVEQGVGFYGLFGVHVADAESAGVSRSRVSFSLCQGVRALARRASR